MRGRLSPPQRALLAALHNHGPLSLGAFGFAGHGAGSTLASYRALLRRGYVTGERFIPVRRASDTDHGVWLWSITPSGEEALFRGAHSPARDGEGRGEG